ncbi:MAG: endonuclease domain-containing protein [Anaerolineales bacterium]
MPRPPRSNPKTRTRAIELRKELTPAERKLWANLRGDQLGVNFRRQHAIGNFIPDFVCIKKKLIIELDGSQHLEQEEYDEERTKYFETLGYKVIRFWNSDVMKNMDGVIRAIIFALEGQSPSKDEKEIKIVEGKCPPSRPSPKCDDGAVEFGGRGMKILNEYFCHHPG